MTSLAAPLRDAEMITARSAAVARLPVRAFEGTPIFNAIALSGDKGIFLLALA